MVVVVVVEAHATKTVDLEGTLLDDADFEAGLLRSL